MKPISVFYRTCYYSKNQELPGRERPEWFDREKVFSNFKKTINNDLADYQVIYDGFYDPRINNHPAPLYLRDNSTKTIVHLHEGTESGSFLKTLDYALSLNLPDDAIVYLLEDDHLHRPGWCEALMEAFELPKVHYVALMDHADKYKDYPDLTSKLFVTKRCHWRTVPSTVNTFACRMGTLRQDAELHRKYSENLTVTNDWAKFEDLQNRGRVLLSPIPGYSTHCVPRDMSPCINWGIYNK